MKKFHLKIVVLLCLFLQQNYLYASVEPAVKSFLQGPVFVDYNASPFYVKNASFVNLLSNFNTSSGTYSFPANEQVRKIDNMLELLLDPDNTTYIDFPYTLEVQLSIVKYELGASTTTNDATTLIINYDPAARSKWTEKADYHFTNSGRVDYTVNSVKLSSAKPLTDQQKKSVSEVVKMRSDIVIERYLDFDVTKPLTGTDIKNAFDVSTQELTISWLQLPGAEYYDLEWAYVDDYKDKGIFIQDNQLLLNIHFNLNRNSTRIQTAQLKYTFPVVFESGYILYRVRGIGMEYESTTDEVFIMPGRWSNPVNGLTNGPDQAPNVHDWYHRFHITAPFEQDKLNWQITTSYAEEGKSKSVIVFGDGSQRNRQTVTGLSTEHEAMAAENIYDHQGRAAIQTLPVPTNDPTLKYYKNFNPNPYGKPYNRLNFDTTSANCGLATDPMATSNGASRYYSPNNPDKSFENAYLPDAFGYPFVQTEFTPDNTGRIRRQSGVGLNHKLGSNHETQYFYSVPAQEELSMLFGVEVGDANHYKKNVVQDPNGQLSVSYLDLKGKVVATALSGNPPANLDPLASYKTYNMDVDLMVFNKVDSIANELVASRSFTVTTRSDYDFSYTVSNAAFEAALCNGIKLCYDCVYDLEITVIDNYSCDSIYFHQTKQINPLTFNSKDSVIIVNDACPKKNTYYGLNSNSSPKAFKIKDLDVGSYTITKTLKVNKAATDAYVKDYLEQFAANCPSVYDNILSSWMKQVDSSMCDIVDSSKALNRCEVAHEGMLADLSPGGQYGLINWVSYTATDPLSVFNESNTLPQSRAGFPANWRHPATQYLDEDGTTASTLINSSGNPVLPGDATITLQEFLDAWEPQWAESLLPYHPEYCYFEWCDADNKSFDFDVELAEVNSYKDAVSKGFLALAHPEDLMKKDPYFKAGGGATTATFRPNLPTDFKSAMLVYYQSPSPSNQKYSMLQVAVMTALQSASQPHTLADAGNWINNPNPASPVADSIWFQFRALYLSKKEEFQYGERTDFAMHHCQNNGGYNEAIGTKNFNWHKNDFDRKKPSGGLFSGPFFVSTQTSSISSFAQYQDKDIRFPSVYNIPVDFDPYGPPDDVIQEFAGWANGMISENCDSCNCSNQAINQFINWVLNHNKNTPPNQLISLPVYPFDPVLQQKLSNCFNSAVTQTKFKIDNNLQRFTIYLQNNVGTNLVTIVMLSNTPNAWEIADSLGCIRYLGTDNAGNIIADAILTYSLLAPNSPVSITITPGCPAWEDWKFCGGKSQVQSCPPTENAKYFAQLLNALISKQELTKTQSVAAYTSPAFAAYFYPVQNIQSPLNWSGQLNNNTINATLSSNQVNCSFTLELPVGLNLTTLGHVISLTPDNTKTDPTTGYTKEAILKVALLNGPGSVNIRVKSACFPLSYCEKCPPETNPKVMVRAAAAPAPKQKTKKRTPGPISPENPIDIGIVNEPHDPNRICFPCDSLGYTLDYDSLVSETQSIMIHKRPPVGICDPCAWPKDTLPTIPIPNPCLEEQVIAAYANAANEYQQYLDSLTRQIRNGYVRHCLAAAETFSMQYMDALHHFTLYYYDQANNLLKTIPPDGVAPLNMADTKLAIQYMRNKTGTAVVPKHSMPSDYTFNSLNQLRKQRIPDHDGESVFFYDYLSRIVVSQNPKQRKPFSAPSEYSYTVYDNLNRPKETGELLNVTTPMTDALAKNEAQLASWIKNNQKREITRTQYDTPLPGIAKLYFNNDASKYRSRVASVTYLEQGGSPVQNSTYYQYDIHGNVKKLVQDVFQLGPKTIAYDYDLISGSVKKVYYQKGEIDQFLHRYEYDADNRITAVKTSFDGMVWDKDAEYHYYKHGPLARTELGEHKVQAMDFAYTIQGWIKGVNSAALDPGIDIGQDGVNGHPHQMVGKDAFGYLLRYFTDDYNMIGAASGGKGWEPAYKGTGFQRSNRDLYNGNIQSMITSIGEPVDANFSIQSLGYAYDYDQVNRITAMRAFGGLNAKFNNWSAAVSLAAYATDYSYDANGNIQTLNRKGANTGSAPLDMDAFQYHYTPGRNQLEYVSDAVAAGNYPDDIDDQSPGNFQYDAIGNLIEDKSENLIIDWNVRGKVKSIQKKGSNELIEFRYDPMGQRVLKRLTNTVTNKVSSTFYVPDVTGNVMATYTDVETPPLKNKIMVWQSVFLYGGSRLGEERIDTSLGALIKIQNKQNNTWYSYRSRGSKYFELGNHLGNVLATVSDRKLAADTNKDLLVDGFAADMETVSDYYPFGGAMPERSFAEGGYRYGFGGQEKDNEVSGNNNSYTSEYWQYDSRLGRRWNIDPINKPWESPYATFSNNPIWFSDPNGADTVSASSVIGGLEQTAAYGQLISSLDERINKISDAINAAKKLLYQAQIQSEIVQKWGKGIGKIYDEYVNSALMQALETKIMSAQMTLDNLIQERNYISDIYNMRLMYIESRLSGTDAILAENDNGMWIYNKNPESETKSSFNITVGGEHFNFGWKNENAVSYEFEKAEHLKRPEIDIPSTALDPRRISMPRSAYKAPKISSSKSVQYAKVKLSDSYHSNTSIKNTWNRFLSSQKGQYTGKYWLQDAMNDYNYYKKVGAIK